ncbi:MAG: prephenate dehydrogenase/arogenate dehydrogenase family protein [Chloroflexi bacterium]|nr:prephenate dehydrogenase/arogenate dehydrogenase family protein [Chloroflexota bacterium]
MPFQQVAILGLGLIGASLGMALKQTSSPPLVVGFDPDQETLRRAKREKAIDRAAATTEAAVRGADTIVLAAPVRAIIDLLADLGPHLDDSALVTDTGSTKAAIVKQASASLPAQAGFVGGHPLAGRLRSGVSGPDAQLFVGSVYCLTPTAGAPPWAVERASELVQSVGATPHFVDPEEHDGLLAAVSHLPYFTAAALVAAVASQSAWPEMAKLAAGGFRTATSLVESSDEMWTDIALTNRGPLLRQLDELIASLSELRSLVSDSQAAELAAMLSRAHRLHTDWVEANEMQAPSSAPRAEPRAQRRRFLFFR